MGNSNRDLLKRLLTLFPIKILKEEFNTRGNSADVIDEITGGQSDAIIKNFASRNQRFSRQNIYLFTLDKNFNPRIIDDSFPISIESNVTNQGETTLFCLPKVTFNVYLSDPVDKEDLKFYQPLTIRIKGKNLIVQYTKLESNIKFYYPENREAKKNSEKNSEETTLRQILTHFEGHQYTVEKNDINKGVKHLWHIDDLDCHKISYRNAHSTNTAVMDADLTFKNKYPVDYQQIIKTPIGSAIWKYLLADNYLCEGFTADLTNGIISITKFPKLPNQVENVIAKILEHN